MTVLTREKLGAPLLVAASLLSMVWLSGCSSPAAPATAATATSAADPSASASSTPSAEYAGPGVERDYESLDAGAFGVDSATVTNPWMPLAPGSRLVHEGTTVDGKDTFKTRLEFTVTDLTKVVAGVKTTVAYVTGYEDGELVEKGVAFFAQDKAGSVWNMGEHPEEFEDGRFDKAPTWIHGVAGAQAGYAIPANPAEGTPSFSEGWAPDVDFLDRGQVKGFEPEVCIKLKCYENVLVVDEFTKAEPDAVQVKYYASGVGNVKVGWRGDDSQQEELELVSTTTLDGEALAKLRQQALSLEKHAYQISPKIYGTTEPMQQVP